LLCVDDVVPAKHLPRYTFVAIRLSCAVAAVLWHTGIFKQQSPAHMGANHDAPFE